MPFDCTQLVRNLFGLLVVNANYVVLPCSREHCPVGVVIQSHYEIALLERVPHLLPCLGRELVEVPAGVGHQEQSRRAVVVLVYGPPSESIDGPRFSHPRVDFAYLIVCAQVEDSYLPIGIATSGHGIFLVKFGDHEFRLLRDDRLHENLILEGDFLGDSG